jgi:sialate O-acetylesterase
MNSKIRLAALFQDGAILQRDCPLRVWGWAPPSCRVRVTLGKNAANSWSSAWGDFRVVLPAMPAGGPHVLRVELPDSPDVAALKVSDIWMGEVWLASGQSNMQWQLRQCGDFAEDAVPSAGYPLLRMFHVEQRAELALQRDVAGSWRTATPENVPDFSAVGFFFARRVQQELGIPVGVIVSAWGGTPIESWMPRSAHATSEFLREKLNQSEALAYSDERWESQKPDGTPNYPADPGLDADSLFWKEKACADSAWPEMELPGSWQRQGHGHSGVFWFRRTLQLPGSWVGRELVLELGAADKHDITFANGIEVGRTGVGFEQEHWNRPRTYRIPGDLVKDTSLLLAVRVYSFVYEGGLLGPSKAMRLSCPALESSESISLTGPWKYQIEQDFGVVVTIQAPGHLSPHSPAILFENMIDPLAPFALRGALWYQGESNTAHAAEYPAHLRSMITAWRNLWELGDFPFLIVQLPGFGIASAFSPESAWALFRQGQLDLVKEMPATGLAVTIDCGEAEDIHPANKQPVGGRLALWALAETYEKELLKSGPLIRTAVLQPDGSILLAFDFTGEGMATSDGKSVGGVFVVDSEGRNHPAAVEIECDALRVRADLSQTPAAVFYAWADFPLGANLVNSEGLPASPFRCAIETPHP